ncbi:MAG: hypothetical protein CVV64_15600 [Candidatus Wallbacteria bacterium HGW-Wallbacteria-1]|jgi:subtilisin family serine protease|uniref:Peptidase S8/S53 domain-containing protein n=1 Tax=Candidatus Wallbacteria bacterium HGW-Wallbacteria-1 TaxID=2013854 RepID=A0A2N1PLH8_9BACT|nr:MAG: hypothetical protein CVV64_15600 [Candidatus Wallbacteria bacterium HGW-Wallbacteria-1]
MKKLASLLAISAFVASTFTAALAAKIPVLVIDSGTDFSHQVLQPVSDPSKKEAAGQPNIDDDNNGYKDDVYGWNFVENNPTLVDLKNTPKRYDDILRFMELMGLYQEVGKENMPPEKFKELVALYQDKELAPWNGFVGGWAHGTHCGGIMAENNDQIKMKAITHIPSGPAPSAREAQELLSLFNARLADLDVSLFGPKYKSIEENPMFPQLKQYFKEMGIKAAQEVEPKAKYIGSLKPRVINCSWGTSNQQLLKVFKQNMTQSWGYKNPTDEDVQKMVNLYVGSVQLRSSMVLFKYVPQALIVIAAGNSTEDNDKLVISPNDTPITNKLVVAATNHDRSIADFSCFGATKVDIAVPGVNIYSTYPNGKMGYMSGTSMAAPLASKYASQVLAVNSKLTPQELKQILMETVDKKDWLKGKVVSEGVINIQRALAAAKSIKDGSSIESAISTARENVPSTELDGPEISAPVFESEFEKELYNSAVF